MNTSRIFIKGLPPTFTEAEFKKHFSQTGKITDAKIFPNRRIGYVGYNTSNDAQKAVKYFNKSFIRMSRIGVELARPIQDGNSGQRNGSTPTARRDFSAQDDVRERDQLKRKRESQGEEEQDPKLKEFLNVMKPKSKKKAWENEGQEVAMEVDVSKQTETVAALPENQSDDEYEVVPRKSKKAKGEPKEHEVEAEAGAEAETPSGKQSPAKNHSNETELGQESPDTPENVQRAVSDSDWARSKTSRLLGLLDEDEEEAATAQATVGDVASDSEADDESEKNTKPFQVIEAESSIPTPKSDDENEKHDESAEVQTIRSSMRLFVRNLPYDTKQADLEAEFESYGNIEEVHVPLDTKTGFAKGFAYIQFTDSDSALMAMHDKDGQTFHGRLLHILPAEKKRETKLDDFALSKLPLKKQQQIKKRRDAGSTSFNWNALYMNADTVVSSVADRLGLSKSEVLDPTSSEAAIKQAHAETHIIQETKAYFNQQGVDLDAFKKSQRGETAILIKNIPYACSKDELRRLFEEHGDLKRFLIPPSGTIAIVEFGSAAQCKAAFSTLAYRKVNGSVLFLEKAPKDLFGAKTSATRDSTAESVISRTSAFELKNTDQDLSEHVGVATLFVRNLNFSTTTPQLTETFAALEGFLSARVKTKTDPKKQGQILSMGFGFLEFRTAQQAQAALQSMDGCTLEGHKLQIRASHKGADAAEDRRNADAERRAAGKHTKVIIKNLPFEASKKDVRALFGAYGQLRSVRVPKKMDQAARGFAFADFTTPKEAESAMNALKDTHLLGRRLVLDFAAEDPEDAEAEIEKMQQKVGAQVNKVALRKLTSGGRKKFSTQNEDDDGT